MRLFFLVTLLVVLGYICIPPKKNFLNQVTSTLKARPEWETDLTSPLSPLVDQILNQKFSYLARGTQSYAFISEDQKYVLKFIKMNHVTPRRITEKLNRIKREKKETKLQQMFGALHYAYHHFKEETGIVFLHLNCTPHWNKKVSLVGKDGENIVLSLDNSCFILQEKAELLYTCLGRLIENNQMEAAKERIRSFLSLIQKRGSLGLFDHDKSISNNFGFLNDRPIQLDVAGLYQAPLDPQAEVARVGLRIRNRIEERFPQFLPHYLEVWHEFQ